MHYLFKGDVAIAREKARTKIKELLDIETCYGHEDIVFYESSKLKVEHWKEIHDHIIYGPSFLKHKVLIFENGHMMSEILQNKLLKLLEDFQSVCLFLVEGEMLETIQSRCTCIEVRSEGHVLPVNARELKTLFGVDEECPEDVKQQLVRFYKALHSEKSLLIDGGLLKEKSPALSVLSNNLDIIIRLIILNDIKNKRIKRSSVAKKYIGCENNSSNLYLLVFELELLEEE